MSEQNLSSALVLLRDISATLQAVQTKTLKMAEGQAPFRPSEVELFLQVMAYLISKADEYISSTEADSLPDMYHRVFSMAYDDLVTTRRALSFSTLSSRHSSGLRVDSDRDIISEQYSAFAEQLAEAEREAQVELRQDELEFGEEFS